MQLRSLCLQSGRDSATLGVACGQPQVQAAASELLVMIGINVQFCFHSKGKAYKGSFLAVGDTVLVLRKGIFHFLTKPVLRDCILPRSGSFVFYS